MIQLAKNLALAAALAILAAAPAHAFVGYGVEAGTPMYDALQRGYQPQLEGRDYFYYPPPQRRSLHAPRRY
jgi:hypothetical protein